MVPVGRERCAERTVLVRVNGVQLVALANIPDLEGTRRRQQEVACMPIMPCQQRNKLAVFLTSRVEVDATHGRICLVVMHERGRAPIPETQRR